MSKKRSDITDSSKKTYQQLIKNKDLMVYEERIATLEELLREIKIIDSDAGIRIDADYKGEDAFIFITRSSPGFAVAIHRKKNDDGLVPAERIEFIKIDNYEKLSDFLLTIVKEPLLAFKY